MTAAQGVLLGCEGWFAPADPMPQGTLRVAEVIDGYCRGSWGKCGAFRKTIAGVLRKSLRWLDERTAWLRRHGIAFFEHRGPHACFVTLAKDFAKLLASHLITESKAESTHSDKTPTLSTVLEASASEPEVETAPRSQDASHDRERDSQTASEYGCGSFTSQAAEGEKPPSGAPGSTPEPPRRDPVSELCSDCPPVGYPPCPRRSESLQQQRRTGPPLIPLGYCEQFRSFYQLFLDASVPLNDYDMKRAHAAWICTAPEQWQAAHDYAATMVLEREPCYVTHPVRLLIEQHWTRVAAPRKFPMPERRKELTAEDIAAL